jgi:hypothetical protein
MLTGGSFSPTPGIRKALDTVRLGGCFGSNPSRAESRLPGGRDTTRPASLRRVVGCSRRVPACPPTWLAESCRGARRTYAFSVQESGSGTFLRALLPVQMPAASSSIPGSFGEPRQARRSQAPARQTRTVRPRVASKPIMISSGRQDTIIHLQHLVYTSVAGTAEQAAWSKEKRG